MAITWEPRSLGERIEAIERGLCEAAGLAAQRVACANESWTARDPVLARAVIDDDERMDVLCLRLEGEVFDAQLLHAPHARDARLLHVTRIVTVALERVGDLASAIAELALRAPADAGEAPVTARRIAFMQDLAMGGLLGVRDAAPDGDPEAAARAAVNATRAQAALVELLADVCDASRTRPPWAAEAALLGRHLERVCDNASEIARRLTFVGSGRW